MSNGPHVPVAAVPWAPQSLHLSKQQWGVQSLCSYMGRREGKTIWDMLYMHDALGLTHIKVKITAVQKAASRPIFYLSLM